MEPLETRALLTGNPLSIDVQGNVVIAVGTQGDESIDVFLGEDTHVLAVSGYQVEFDASVIDTIRIGSGYGNDSVRVVGTDLDDVGNVLDNHGSLISSDYEAVSYTHLTLPTKAEV